MRKDAMNLGFASATLAAAWLVGAGPVARAEIRISEVMPINRAVLEDEDGDTSDWIEVRNGGDKRVNLQGYHLTDDQDILDKWTFPFVSLGPGKVVDAVKARGAPPG